MKPVTMFFLPTCPHCVNAFSMIEELKAKYPELASINITTVNEKEETALAESYDYYYVPTYYVDDDKLHEGVPTLEKLEAVLRAALPS